MHLCAGTCSIFPATPEELAVAKSRQSEIVVVGGGAVGCGVAYQLARAGHTDVLVIEKEPALASVTTSQAAGLVGQVRNTLERTRLAMWSVQTFSELEQDTTARKTNDKESEISCKIFMGYGIIRFYSRLISADLPTIF